MCPSALIPSILLWDRNHSGSCVEVWQKHFFCFVLLCCYSVLQCKAVQTLASFHLTEYEVTEWAADLNLLLLDYLGGGAEGGTQHHILCIQSI